MNRQNDPLYYYNKASVRQDMIALMPGNPGNVLEVGCGVGKTGAALKEAFGCKVTGIDISSSAIDVARQKKVYDKTIVCDLDKEAIPAEMAHDRFDAILYPDVLEHLRDPLKVLLAHLNLLKPGGLVVSSIPNIRHWPILKNLVFKGRWQYQDMGILDRTHLRFFTKTEIEILFKEAGLSVGMIKPKGIAAPNWLKITNKLFFGKLEEFLVKQYLVCAKKL